LAKWKVAAKGIEPGGGEAIGQRDQQRRVAVSSRAVRQHQESGAGLSVMQKSLHRRLSGSAIYKRFCLHGGHDNYRTKILYSMM
jgi:hypothetical protein